MGTPDVARSTVLVVDDEPRNRALVRGFLESHYRVVEAENAAQALDIVRQDAIDLVLLDVMMPKVSGYEACGQIKALQGETFLPVLLLTALDEQANRNMGLEVGADDYLVKPIDRRELLLRVRAFLRLREQEKVIRQQLVALHRLDALKDDLVSLIVHDLRNPLTGLMSLLHLARPSQPDAQLEQDISHALLAAGRLNDSIEDLLRVRVLEEGRVVPALEACSLAALAQDAMSTVQGAARMQGVELAVVGPRDLAWSVDKKLVRRALENLLFNSIKYASRGDTVEAEVVPLPRGGVALEIKDRGPGIAAPDKAGLFQKFGVVGARRDARRGFGLGLYLVQLVANVHNATVAVDDRQGGGTCFRLSFARPVEAN